MVLVAPSMILKYCTPLGETSKLRVKFIDSDVLFTLTQRFLTGTWLYRQVPTSGVFTPDYL